MSRSLHSTSSRPPRGFTLVEILVVVSIIVILMAILIPVAMRAISKARDAAIGVELSQLKAALEEYKREHGDYPPSMGQNYNVPSGACYSTICERHLLRCYPKTDPSHKTFFYNAIAPRIGNDEALVFWLALIANDPRYPFKNFAIDNNGNFGFAPLPGTTVLTQYPGPYTRFVHYDFDQRRVRDLDGDVMPSYAALYARDTPYVYFDSRTYRLHMHPTTAGAGACQPYMDYLKVQATIVNTNLPADGAFVNPNTFQIHCAGQDGNFGGLAPAVDPNNNFQWNNNWQTMVKTFPNMTGQYCTEEDSDNMADFTEGRRLIDHRAP